MPPLLEKVSVEPSFAPAEEPEERANRRRFLSAILIVGMFAAISLIAYLNLRAPNRHLEPTPYDDLVGQLRSRMSEEDVRGLFRSVSQNVPRATYGEYEEPASSGGHRVLTYRIGEDEPLQVRFGGLSGHTLTDWCYRDHCHDNVE